MSIAIKFHKKIKLYSYAKNKCTIKLRNIILYNIKLLWKMSESTILYFFRPTKYITLVFLDHPIYNKYNVFLYGNLFTQKNQISYSKSINFSHNCYSKSQYRYKFNKHIKSRVKSNWCVFHGTEIVFHFHLKNFTKHLSKEIKNFDKRISVTM